MNQILLFILPLLLQTNIFLGGTKEDVKVFTDANKCVCENIDSNQYLYNCNGTYYIWEFNDKNQIISLSLQANISMYDKYKDMILKWGYVEVSTGIFESKLSNAYLIKEKDGKSIIVMFEYK